MPLGRAQSLGPALCFVRQAFPSGRLFLFHSCLRKENRNGAYHDPTIVEPQGLTGTRQATDAARQARPAPPHPTAKGHRSQQDRGDLTYRPQEIEAYWREQWAETGLYRTPEHVSEGTPTFYCLDFFPYPSGAGLSVGHGRNYVPTDVISRYKRMQAYAVLHPMGWDAFGLPAENEALKKGIHPQETTTRYAANYRRQMTLMGCSYDWEREINSSSPDYYRWTQWLFLLLYRRGLAYRALGRQWWCPECQTVLANEQVSADGTCWRNHSGVYKRDLEQWYLRITAYAGELLSGLDALDWPEHIVAMQRNWIGRSEGVEFDVPVAGRQATLTVYTTRPDTVFGMTFAVLAPEHPMVRQITTPERSTAVDDYCRQAALRSEVARQKSAGSDAQDGVFSGAFATNPFTGEPIPVYVADYVLLGHGTGAIMSVPAHDERDYAFARRHGISAPVVIAPPGWAGGELSSAYTGAGTMVNSGRWNGLASETAAEQIADWIVAQGIGRRTVHYRMRDWLISRQRYWGAPIPIVYCDECGVVLVPEGDLPVRLPHIEAWRPGRDGRSPLANVDRFVRTTCPQCGGPARREADTLTGFACSSWYFLRFTSPRYADGPFDPQALKRWGAPDLYVGGAEHAVMHLLYARFWTKVMADAGLIRFREPFPVLRSQGVMHARDPASGQVSRMGKSRGNVVTPDRVAQEHGADALRVYLLFIAPFEYNTVWDDEGIVGAERFLHRAWRLAVAVAAARVTARAGSTDQSPPVVSDLHRTIERVSADLEAFRFNTAIAALMEFQNRLIAHHAEHGVTAALSQCVRSLVLLLAPFAPHVAEELWRRLGQPYSVHQQPWPCFDVEAVQQDTFTLVVQVDGRVRHRLIAPVGIAGGEAYALARDSDTVRRHLAQRQVQRTVYVPGRLINIITAPGVDQSQGTSG